MFVYRVLFIVWDDCVTKKETKSWVRGEDSHLLPRTDSTLCSMSVSSWGNLPTTGPNCTALHCIALQCNSLHCTVLSCTVGRFEIKQFALIDILLDIWSWCWRSRSTCNISSSPNRIRDAICDRWHAPNCDMGAAAKRPFKAPAPPRRTQLRPAAALICFQMLPNAPNSSWNALKISKLLS